MLQGGWPDCSYQAQAMQTTTSQASYSSQSSMDSDDSIYPCSTDSVSPVERSFYPDPAYSNPPFGQPPYTRMAYPTMDHCTSPVGGNSMDSYGNPGGMLPVDQPSGHTLFPWNPTFSQWARVRSPESDRYVTL